MPLDVQETLVEFGRIRNRFAHDISTVLVDADVAKIVRTLPADISKSLRARPRAIEHFQWVLLLLCQELHRLLPDEAGDEPEAFVPEDRISFFETFNEMMLELDDGETSNANNATTHVIPLDRGKRP